MPATEWGVRIVGRYGQHVVGFGDGEKDARSFHETWADGRGLPFRTELLIREIGDWHEAGRRDETPVEDQ